MEQIIDPCSRPPAPLPPAPVQDVPEEDYEDPDELERQDSIQWPSPYEEIRVRSIKKQENSSSDGHAHVIPRPPSLLVSVNYPQQPGNVLHSSFGRQLSHEVGQPPLPKPRKVSESGQSQSQLSQLSGGLASHPPIQKMSSTNPTLFDHNSAPLSTHTTTQSIGEEPSELPGKKKTSLVNSTSPPTVILEEHETSTTSNILYRTSDYDASSCPIGSQRVDRPTYCNIPPPLPEPRKDADGYTIPCTDPSILRTSDDCSSSEDSRGYIKCIP